MMRLLPAQEKRPTPRSITDLFDLKTAELITESYPKLEPKLVEWKLLDETGFSITLPADGQAQYSFVLCELGGEKQIVAERKNSAEKEYFYFFPFELAAFRNDISQLNSEFNKRLEIVLSHQTRVRQRKGLLFRGFHCEYLDNGRWRNLGGDGLALRGVGWKFPSAPLYRDVCYRGPEPRLAK